MSSRQSIDLMLQANGAGYIVGLAFVILASADLNVYRVADRVRKGGHDIPEDAIRRRYDRAFLGLGAAVPLAHGCVTYDNSGFEPELLLAIRERRIEPNCLDREKALHARLAESVGAGLGLVFDEVFGSAKTR